jgi:hypothetical protein
VRVEAAGRLLSCRARPAPGRGVRSVFATCLAYGHKTKVNVDAWPDGVPVPSFGRHMRCTLVRQSRRHCDTELDRAGGQIAEGILTSPRRTLERRRPLELLASSQHGTSEELLVLGYGFSPQQLAGLIRRKLTAAEREVVKAGGETIEISRTRITKVERQAIEG